jgi:hypothetical protein
MNCAVHDVKDGQCITAKLMIRTDANRVDMKPHPRHPMIHFRKRAEKNGEHAYKGVEPAITNTIGEGKISLAKKTNRDSHNLAAAIPKIESRTVRS